MPTREKIFDRVNIPITKVRVMTKLGHDFVNDAAQKGLQGEVMATRDEILDRFNYRPPTEAQKALLAECHTRIVACAEFLVDQVPDSRDRAVALTALEDVRMKMNKAIIFSEVG